MQCSVFYFLLVKAWFKLTYQKESSCFIDNLDQYGITSFGVSCTTLEEVFMKVGEGAEKTVDDM